MKKLRLLLFSQCNRSCAGCCNKDWDVGKLPICRDVKGFSEIILTGGEPMLWPGFVEEVILATKKETDSPIFLYTADVTKIKEACHILSMLDGMTVTLHEESDVASFSKFQEQVKMFGLNLGKSLRLNIFDGVSVPNDTEGWTVKTGIRWIKDCPLPSDEIFMRF